jgi:hypothetical protein
MNGDSLFGHFGLARILFFLAFCIVHCLWIYLFISVGFIYDIISEYIEFNYI